MKCLTTRRQDERKQFLTSAAAKPCAGSHRAETNPIIRTSTKARLRQVLGMARFSVQQRKMNMLGKIFSPLTTPTSVGVAIRYLTTIAGSVLAILGILDWLTPEQVTELTKQVPKLMGAIGALMTIGVPTYATITKSSSDKAAVAAKQIDAKLPASEPVIIKTSAGKPDIVVSKNATVSR